MHSLLSVPAHACVSYSVDWHVVQAKTRYRIIKSILVLYYCLFCCLGALNRDSQWYNQVLITCIHKNVNIMKTLCHLGDIQYFTKTRKKAKTESLRGLRPRKKVSYVKLDIDQRTQKVILKCIANFLELVPNRWNELKLDNFINWDTNLRKPQTYSNKTLCMPQYRLKLWYAIPITAEKFIQSPFL